MQCQQTDWHKAKTKVNSYTTIQVKPQNRYDVKIYEFIFKTFKQNIAQINTNINTPDLFEAKPAEP